MNKLLGAIVFSAVIGAAAGAEPDNVDLLYQRALYMETAKADYDAAIPIYATIISQHAQNTALVAKALYRQGVCYEKTGRTDLARDCAKRLNTEFQSAMRADTEISRWAERLGATAVAGGELKLQLPENPSKEQARAYIAAVLDAEKAAVRGIAVSWDASALSTCSRLLKRVGPANLDLLIEALATTRGVADWHLHKAVEAVADESSQKLILENLDAYPGFVRIVLKQGWVQPAREVLLRELKNQTEGLPGEWMQAVIALNDPSTYPLLRNYFIKCANRTQTFEYIKKLPIANLSGAVREAWEASRNSPSRSSMACIAAGYGLFDALEVLMERLTEPGLEWREQGDVGALRVAVAKATGVSGSKEELTRWWKTNRGHLRFDRATGQFVSAIAPVVPAASSEQSAVPAPSERKPVPAPLASANASTPPASPQSAVAESRRALARTELPPQPTKEQVRRYISEVCSLSQSARQGPGMSSADPAVQKLKEVGPENAELLIEALDRFPSNHYHLESAIRGIAHERSKKAILEGLPLHPNALLDIILAKSWEEAAKPTLEKMLKDAGNQSVSPKLIRAIANLRDPALYPQLRKYFVSGINSSDTYEVIKDLPIENMEGAVAEAWKATPADTFGYRRFFMAEIAAQYGHLDALEVLAETAETTNAAEYLTKKAREAFYRFTEFVGDKKEVFSWFWANRTRLRFDPAKRKFVVAADQPANQSPAPDPAVTPAKTP